MPANPRLPDWTAVAGLAGLDLTKFSDRSCSAEETISRVSPYLGKLGITRLARQTDLDRIGLPCWSAVRPNSRFLSTSHGKGLSDAAACASALMEAAEVAVSEDLPRRRKHRVRASDLRREGRLWFDPSRLMRRDFDESLEIYWLLGRELHTGDEVWVPVDAVDLNSERTELPSICKTSNGLASGNTSAEATFHGLCELIERDGTTLASLETLDEATSRCFSSTELHNSVVDALSGLIAEGGFTLTLFDQTSDIGVPVVMAIIAPRGRGTPAHSEVAAGWGCHPVPERAAIRAITEAAQCRITAIAASRDDLRHRSYSMAASKDVLAQVNARPTSAPPPGLPIGTPPKVLLDHMIRATARRGISVVGVDISDGQFPFSVVKLLSPDLEDRDANLNWKPGTRSEYWLGAA